MFTKPYWEAGTRHRECFVSLTEKRQSSTSKATLIWKVPVLSIPDINHKVVYLHRRGFLQGQKNFKLLRPNTKYKLKPVMQVEPVGLYTVLRYICGSFRKIRLQLTAVICTTGSFGLLAPLKWDRQMLSSQFCLPITFLTLLWDWVLSFREPAYSLAEQDSWF